MKELTDWWVSRTEPRVLAQSMWDSWQAPHRLNIPLGFRMLQPIESAYELGCGSGPNLRLLKEMKPSLPIGGSEPSPALAGWASEHLGVHIDQLSLPEVPRDHWDVFVTCYTLAYVEPEDVVTALKNLDGRALVLLEPQGNVAGQGAGLMRLHSNGEDYGLPEWHHDYPSLLAASGWRLTWRWPIMPPVQGLNAALIAER